MIVAIFQYVAGGLLVLGSAFSLLAALGLLRFPDVYTRLHAATKAGTVGAGFVLLAVVFASFDLSISLRALGGIAFIILTSPIAAHLLARAAYLSGDRPSNITVVNELVNEKYE
jgi:multicomponent Na+:H+ antiporter subunit G